MIQKTVEAMLISKKTIQETFANNLRNFRKSEGLTQVQCAQKAQIDYRHYQELESGRVNPTIVTVWAIAEALDLTPNDLLI